MAGAMASAAAQMPIVQTNYTADPAPLVYNDTIYLYTSHDDDKAEGFLMKFYMYCPLHGHGIGVHVADSPYGPFKDPHGEPLVWQKEHRNSRSGIYSISTAGSLTENNEVV